MKKNLLLTPGPTQIPPELCAALGRPIIHHRTPQFQAYIKEAIEGLKYVFQTKNDVYMTASSGTGAMEAAVVNLLSPGDKALTIEGGKFGERWTELCQAYQIKTEVLAITWGKAVQADQIKVCLAKDKDIKAVFITLCETSTGVTPNIKAIAQAVKSTSAVLVVDAVSGLGVEDLQMDNWGVDVVVSGSHKGFMLPPGVGLIAVSPKAWKLVEASKSPRYYFDLRFYKKALEDTDTPYTPAIGIVIALVESLQFFREKGLEKVFAQSARLARGTRAAAQALGMKLHADDSCQSNTLTAILLPEGLNGEKLVKTMRDVHGVTIAGGQGTLKGKLIRIAHMGVIDEYDILTGISCLEKTLYSMNHSFTLGAGVSAAHKEFNG